MRIAKADLVPTTANLLDEYASFHELVEACDAFCDKVNHRTKHRITRRFPAEMLAEEATQFHPVPEVPHTVRGLADRCASRQVVVFWGGRIDDLVGVDGVLATIRGITILSGSHLRQWVSSFESSCAVETIDRSYDRIARYVERHDPLDETFHDVPNSLERELVRVSSMVVVGLIAAFAPLLTVAVLPSLAYSLSYHRTTGDRWNGLGMARQGVVDLVPTCDRGCGGRPGARGRAHSERSPDIGA